MTPTSEEDWETVREAIGLGEREARASWVDWTSELTVAYAALTRLQATETRLREALNVLADGNHTWDGEDCWEVHRIARQALNHVEGVP